MASKLSILTIISTTALLVSTTIATPPNNDPTAVHFDEHTNNHNLPHQQCLGNPQQPFYIPFYLNNPTAAQSAIPPPSTHPDVIDTVLGGESKLTVDELTTRICFNCNEVMQFISQEKHSLIEDPNNRTCKTDNDCTTTWANTALRGGCQSFTNQHGRELLTQWLSKWDCFLEGSNQIESYRGQCGYATPMCMPLGTACVEGKCEGARQRQDVIHYSTVESNVVGGHQHNGV